MEQGDIALLQLVTGQIVIGYIEVADPVGDTTYIVDKPFEVIVVPNPNTGRQEPRLTEYGRAGGLLPPLEYARFRANHVLHPRPCPPQLERAYLAASSGIALATPEQKSAIITGA